MKKITDFNEYVAYFDYDKTKERLYVKLEDLFKKNGKDEIYKVLGIYINDGKYGEQGSAVLEDNQVNLPKHMTETLKEIISDENLVNDINDGKVGFKIYEYQPRNYDMKAYSISWVEIEPEFIQVEVDDIPF